VTPFEVCIYIVSVAGVAALWHVALTLRAISETLRRNAGNAPAMSSEMHAIKKEVRRAFRRAG